jgi:hypothetical protein
MTEFVAFIAAVLLTSAAALQVEQPKKDTGVIELFEDDVDGILKVLTNPGDGAGQGQADPDAFSGKTCLKVMQYQKFNRQLPGWDYAIREKPKAGEYRYLRFAWKSDGANCMMLQLHDATDWHIRYTAGPNAYGWQTQFVAPKAPAVWSLVTIDLFKDFGERNIKGIAFTISGGAGSFDHVYLGNSIDALDRIDANGLANKKVALAPKELEQCWLELADQDASKIYRAFWTLVGGREDSIAFLKEKIAPTKKGDVDEKQIRTWIRELGSSTFLVRERAMAELKKRLEQVAPLLEAEAAETKAVETRRRLESLLAELPVRDLELRRRGIARRALELISESTSEPRTK